MSGSRRKGCRFLLGEIDDKTMDDEFMDAAHGIGAGLRC